jgi:hypothetical protein
MNDLVVEMGKAGKKIMIFCDTIDPANPEPMQVRLSPNFDPEFLKGVKMCTPGMIDKILAARG